MTDDIKRCDWCGHDPLYVDYHDTEWGRPDTDSRALFEKLILDGFQAGLSWITILKKRPAFRKGFDNFDPEKIARYGDHEVERLLADPGIVRHRGKIEATINNARRACEMVNGGQSLVDWLWAWAVDVPERDETGDGLAIPATTARSAALAKELKSMGWKFFGPTTAYAFMQSEGLTNDHEPDCFVHQACEAERSAFLAGRQLRTL